MKPQSVFSQSQTSRLNGLEPKPTDIMFTSIMRYTCTLYSTVLPTLWMETFVPKSPHKTGLPLQKKTTRKEMEKLVMSKLARKTHTQVISMKFSYYVRAAMNIQAATAAGATIHGHKFWQELRQVTHQHQHPIHRYSSGSLITSS